MPVMLGVGVVAGGLILALQALLFMMVVHSLNAGVTMRILAQIGPGGPLNKEIQDFAEFLWFPAALALSIPLGVFAYHRAGERPALKLAAIAITAALLVLAASVAFNYSVTRSVDGVLRSAGGLLREAVLVAVAVGLGVAVGSVLGRRTQKGFLFGRLLETVPQTDREAVLDLLAPVAATSSDLDRRNAGIAPRRHSETDTANPSAS